MKFLGKSKIFFALIFAVIGGLGVQEIRHQRRYQKMQSIIAPYFDEKYYRQQYKDGLTLWLTQHKGKKAIDHYMMIGEKEKKNPNAWFRTSLYSEASNDLFAHFLKHRTLKEERYFVYDLIFGMNQKDTCIVFDIDGTLTKYHRREDLLGKIQDESFLEKRHLRIQNCLLLDQLINLGYTLVFSSAYRDPSSSLKIIHEIGKIFGIETLTFINGKIPNALKKKYDLFFKKSLQKKIYIACIKKKSPVVTQKNISLFLL